MNLEEAVEIPKVGRSTFTESEGYTDCSMINRGSNTIRFSKKFMRLFEAFGKEVRFTLLKDSKGNMAFVTTSDGAGTAFPTNSTIKSVAWTDAISEAVPKIDNYCGFEITKERLFDEGSEFEKLVVEIKLVEFNDETQMKLAEKTAMAKARIHASLAKHGGSLRKIANLVP